VVSIGKKRLRRQRVHGLRARDPGDGVHRERHDALLGERLSELRVDERLEERDEDRAGAKLVDLRRRRLLDLEDELGVERVVDEARAGLLVGAIDERGLDARAALDEDLVAGLDETLGGLGDEGDAALAGHGLSRDTDPHWGFRRYQRARATAPRGWLRRVSSPPRRPDLPSRSSP